MTSIEIMKCDNCGKTTEDFYKEDGWILLGDIDYITITHGRDSSGQAITSYKSPLPEILSFCSVKCFTEYIEKLAKGDKNE